MYKYCLFIFYFLLTFSVSSNAIPIRYSIEGNVRAVYGDEIAIENLTLKAGDPVVFSFIIDENVRGFTDYGNEDIGCVEDRISENEIVTSYYAELEYISYSIADTYYDWGHTNYLASDIKSELSFENEYTLVVVGQERIYFDSNIFLKNKTIGDTITGVHWWHDSFSEKFMTMYVDLFITEIEEVEDFEPNLACGRKDNVIEEPSEIKSGGGSTPPLITMLIILCLAYRKIKNT